VRPTVAAQIGRLAFEFNYWNPKYREFPILLICEEAHAYIPRASESQFAGSRKSMERIAKEGRKYGVGLAVVSQRPTKSPITVLANAEHSSVCGSRIPTIKPTFVASFPRARETWSASLQAWDEAKHWSSGGRPASNAASVRQTEPDAQQR